MEKSGSEAVKAGNKRDPHRDYGSPWLTRFLLCLSVMHNKPTPIYKHFCFRAGNACTTNGFFSPIPK